MSTVYQYCSVLVPVLHKLGEYSLSVPLYRSVLVPIRPLIQVGLSYSHIRGARIHFELRPLREGFQPSLLRCAFPSVSSLTIDRANTPALTGFGLGALAFYPLRAATERSLARKERWHLRSYRRRRRGKAPS